MIPPPVFRIYVDQRAVSRNAGRQDDEQEPVFVIERDGVQTLAHGVTINGPSRLCYDRNQQPRAWLEASGVS